MPTGLVWPKGCRWKHTYHACRITTDNAINETMSAQNPNAIKPVPEGCMEIPGYILDVFNGSAWITQDGHVTDKWEERGVWPTPEAAAEMMQRCLNP